MDEFDKLADEVEGSEEKDSYMSDSQLATLIDRQSEQAIGANDLTQDQRDAAYEFYHGEAKGMLSPPDIDGRSRVVSKDLMDVVEWAMPALMDVFAASDEIIRFEPDGPEDEQSARDATQYISWLLERKNEDAFVTKYDAIKSALIARAGFGKCYVDRHQEYREESYEGLSAEDVAILRQDPEIEIIEESEVESLDVQFDPFVPMQPQQPQVTYTIKAKRAEEVVMVRNEGVPPEEVRLSKETRTMNECPFIEHLRQVPLSYLYEQEYDEEKIKSLSSDDGHEVDTNEASRTLYDDSDPINTEPIDKSQKLVWLSESYLKVDFDCDGKTEYRRVLKVRNVIFENEVVDDHPFWCMSPILMPYKVLGVGFWDLVEDLQRVKTALMRQTLDNVYLTNNPMKEVVESQILDMDEILNPRVGGVFRVKNANAVRDVVTPFVGDSSMALMTAIDGIRDTRTGVTEMNSSVNAESLSKTNVGSQGIQAMMQAGAQRIRLIARVLAETGFKRMYYLALKHTTQHNNREQQIKVNGRWLQIDPREWKNHYNMTVSVGTGNFGKQEQLMNLSQVYTLQKEVMPLGLSNPATVYQTAKRMTETMGYRDADQFFVAPQQGQQPQQQGQQDPSAAAAQAAAAQAQALIQAEQIKAQASLQKADKDNETKLVIADRQIASQERVAMFEAQQRAELERQKAANDFNKSILEANYDAARTREQGNSGQTTAREPGSPSGV